MRTDGLQGEAINIGMENEVTIRTVAEVIVDICDADSNFVYEPLPEDDPRKRLPDITKARRLLDCEPDVPLDAGLRRTLEHFRTRERLTPDDAPSLDDDV